MAYFDLSASAARGDRIHLVGIGGVSMSALAGTLLSSGATVTGSDRQASPVTDRLACEGAVIFAGHRAEQVEGAVAVIRTAAVHDDNPEIRRARELGIPVLSRAESWGQLMKNYRSVICIAGTHGKTTTTAMAAAVTLGAGLDPTIMIGGTLAQIGGTYRIGGRGLFVAESCEYCNSYHSFCPTTAVILNVERDHLDFFKDLDDIVASFRTFAEKTPPDGLVVVNRDDENAMRAVKGIERRVVTFGMTALADVYPADLALTGGYYAFDIMIRGEKYTSVTLKIPGLHNVTNTLACAAALFSEGVAGEKFAAGVASFSGAGRRFERKGSFHGAVVVDDYAHHPDEIAATLKTARSMGFARVICVFQPHTYTRTLAFFDDFVRSLSLADVPVLTEVYAAREDNETGFSAEELADEIPDALFFPTFEGILDWLTGELKAGDLCIVMGAGNIVDVADRLMESGERDVALTRIK